MTKKKAQPVKEDTRIEAYKMEIENLNSCVAEAQKETRILRERMRQALDEDADKIRHLSHELFKAKEELRLFYLLRDSLEREVRLTDALNNSLKGQR